MAIDVKELQSLQSNGFTVGVVAKDGSLRIRLEIDDFIQERDVANLYLLALDDLMKERWETDHPFSFFQMAGIHGKPWEKWDNVGPQNDSEFNEYAGYCSHSSLLFPSWHRAYLMMFEQSLFLRMSSIADLYPESHRQTYQAAVLKFALPYWDPFLPRQKLMNVHGYPFYRTGLPIIMTVPQVRVRKPDNPEDLVNMPNPLYRFEFPAETNKWNEKAPFQWADKQHPTNAPESFSLGTVRGMTPSGETDSLFVNKTLDYALSHSTGRGLPLGGKMYRILLGPELSYMEVSNTAYVPRNEKEPTFNEQNSIEGFHNDIHVMCGAGPGNGSPGHMGLNEYAAFDPIFWLHHTNIDRLFGIWQSLNPTKWIEEEGQQLRGPATFVTSSGYVEKADTALVPFRRKTLGLDGLKWWTSADLRSCSAGGYTYPQIPKGTDVSSLRRWVNENFEWTTIGGTPPVVKTLFNSESFRTLEIFPVDIKIDGKTDLPKHDEFKVTGGLAKTIKKVVGSLRRHTGSIDPRYKHIADLIHEGKILHWNATVRVEKFALNGSFTIFLFLGDPCEDPTTWHHDRNMIGSDGIFASATREHCANCREQHEHHLLDADTIPLTTPLITYWRSQEELNGLTLKSLYPPDVVPFLKWNLHWRVLDQFGRVQNPEDVASFKIQVGSQVVELPTDPTQAPKYGPERVWTDITDSRSGGLNRHERFADV